MVCWVFRASPKGSEAKQTGSFQVFIGSIKGM